MTFYISNSGNNLNDGSYANPWASLSYACSQVTLPDSIIFVRAGMYIEPNECVLNVGVSIDGEGDTSVIVSHFTTTRDGGSNHGSILLKSETDGVNGNQTIRNIKLNGENIGSLGIVVKRRSNVKIHNVNINDFYINGVTFCGSLSLYAEPSIYATNNEIYDCSIKYCGQEDGTWNGGGVFACSGQEGLKLHNSTLDATGHAQGHNGNTLQLEYYNKGCKIYNNKSYKPDYDGGAWNFHMESWNVVGGMELYDNEFIGGEYVLDVAGQFNLKGDYAYSWLIHDNYFTTASGDFMGPTGNRMAIVLEGFEVYDVKIYNNHFNKLRKAIGIWEGGGAGSSSKQRISIYDNLFEGCGSVAGQYVEQCFIINNKYVDSSYSDISFYNNTIVANQYGLIPGIDISIAGSISNLNIKNNIIKGFQNWGFLSVHNTGIFNGLHVDNNLLYDNVRDKYGLSGGPYHNTVYFTGNTVTNYTFLNNITGMSTDNPDIHNPLFVSSTDFRLQRNSPAVDKGVNVGLAYTGIAPDMGAFEYSLNLPIGGDTPPEDPSTGDPSTGGPSTGDPSTGDPSINSPINSPIKNNILTVNLYAKNPFPNIPEDIHSELFRYEPATTNQVIIPIDVSNNPPFTTRFYAGNLAFKEQQKNTKMKLAKAKRRGL